MLHGQVELSLHLKVMRRPQHAAGAVLAVALLAIGTYFNVLRCASDAAGVCWVAVLIRSTGTSARPQLQLLLARATATPSSLPAAQ